MKVLRLLNNTYRCENKFATIVDYLASIERNATLASNVLEETGSKALRLFSYSVYSERSCGPARILNYGNYYCGVKPAIAPRSASPSKMNLQRCIFKLGVVPLPPFMKKNDVLEESVPEGAEWWLFKAIAEKLNSTLEIVWLFNGTMARNGVSRAEMDVAIGTLFQKDHPGVIYSTSYMFWAGNVLMPKKDPMPLWLNLWLPLQPTVWIAVIASVIIGCILTSRIPIIRKELPPPSILGIFLGLGEVEKARRISSRIYFCSWAICGYVIVQSYLADLTGRFTIPTPQKEIQSVEELERSGYPFAGIGVTREEFQESNPGLYQRYEELADFDTYKLMSDMMHKRAKSALYTDGITIRLFAGNAKKRGIVHQIPEDLRLYPTAALLPEGSKLLSTVNRAITDLFETGHIEHWMDEYAKLENKSMGFYESAEPLESETPEEPEESSEKSRTYTTDDFQGVFIIYSIGISASSLAFLIELLSKYKFPLYKLVLKLRTYLVFSKVQVPI
ncbi:uncharacterized protein LOC105694660 [Orussus abietinus]|uniref:uncharacterized protein LOC105694660 n=1 Tax=Orussus abietinus TaxID=222816 RepID=UPI0006268044|nr:uncharacterized protein LOC105694660 [Orussus abietinus]